MSFSGDIKEELVKLIPTGRHCQLAELSALYKFCNKEIVENSGQIVITTENELAAQKCFTLLKKTFNMYKDYSWGDFCDKKGALYSLPLGDETYVQQIEQALNSKVVTQRACCKRAYVRGAFIAAGSVSDPKKSYHFEFVCLLEDDAKLVSELLLAFDIEAKIIVRKKYHVLYVKDGTQIVDILNVMGAHIAMMDFENIRILKEVRNSVNRKMNCEMANISKTVSASTKQAEEIRLLMSDEKFYRTIPQNLRDMAELRLAYPEATLAELGELSDPPLGKSGVNHRLRKLSEFAEIVKEEKYE